MQHDESESELAVLMPLNFENCVRCSKRLNGKKKYPLEICFPLL